MPDTPILDLSRFNALRASCAPPVFDSLLTSFREQFPAHQHQLQLCADRGDTEGLRRIAHQYRGFAGSFGAMQLGALASRIEDEEDFGSLQDAVRAIDSVSQETWRAIEAARSA